MPGGLTDLIFSIIGNTAEGSKSITDFADKAGVDVEKMAEQFAEVFAKMTERVADFVSETSPLLGKFVSGMFQATKAIEGAGTAAEGAAASFFVLAGAAAAIVLVDAAMVA